MTIVRGRIDMIVCREAQVNIWTRLQLYDGRAISYDVLRRHTTMTRPWYNIVRRPYTWEHVKIWYKRRMTSREVARRRAMIVRYSISGFATRFLNMTKNRQDILQPLLTSHDYARFIADGPRSPKFRPSQVVVRFLKAWCDHSLRDIKFNVRPSHNVARGHTTIAQDIYEKSIWCLSLICSV